MFAQRCGLVLSIVVIAVLVVRVTVGRAPLLVAVVTPRVWSLVTPSVDVAVDAGPVIVPSPCWSCDVCLLCLVLVLPSVSAINVIVLTMLPFFETADDVRVSLDGAVAILVVSAVTDALRVAVVVTAVVLETLLNTVLATPAV